MQESLDFVKLARQAPREVWRLVKKRPRPLLIEDKKVWHDHFSSLLKHPDSTKQENNAMTTAVALPTLLILTYSRRTLMPSRQ